MAMQLSLEPCFSVGLYDSDTGESLTAEKVVDVTEECGERTIFLYTRAKRGRIVQIVHPYEGEKYMGSHTHFFIDELSRCDTDDTFQRLARRAKMPRFVFLDLILDNAPTPEDELIKDLEAMAEKAEIKRLREALY